MKKIIYILFVLIGLVFTGCEAPLEETYEELGDVSNIIVGANDYTITEDDYTALLLDGYFNSTEEAGALIPALLEDLYPALGEGSLANVTFNLENAIAPIEYTVTADDYAELIAGGDISDPYLTGFSDIQDFFSYKFPQNAKGSYVKLTYQSLAEKILYTLTADDYDLVGNGNFDNFDIRPGGDEEAIAVRISKISQILDTNFSDAPIGQQYEVTYAIFDGSSGELTITLEFTGSDYIEVTSNVVSYILESSDYDLIVSSLSATYPDATSSMSNFGNFERRPDNDSYWTDSMVIEALDIVLVNAFPSAAEGALYSVTISIFNGSGGTETFILELSGGTYIESEVPPALVTETNLFVLADDWIAPFTLEEEDYDAMGQRFPNFSDEEEALYKIGVFLKLEFPFASPDDFLGVAYDFFASGEVTERYTNFTFDGTTWIGAPEIIETSIQFGKEDGEWIPDNTITYILSAGDFDTIASALETTEGFEGPASSAGRFGNFDRRVGNANEWTDEMVTVALGIILDSLDPTAEEGQKYTVTAAIFNGANTTEDFKVVKQSGVWIDNN